MVLIMTKSCHFKGFEVTYFDIALLKSVFWGLFWVVWCRGVFSMVFYCSLFSACSCSNMAASLSMHITHMCPYFPHFSVLASCSSSFMVMGNFKIKTWSIKQKSQFILAAPIYAHALGTNIGIFLFGVIWENDTIFLYYKSVCKFYNFSFFSVAKIAYQ